MRLKKGIVGVAMAAVLTVTSVFWFSQPTSAASYKYQCGSCGQKFSSKVSSHNHTVTCGGHMISYSEKCGGHVTHHYLGCDGIVSITTGTTQDNDNLYYAHGYCSKGHGVRVNSLYPNYTVKW